MGKIENAVQWALNIASDNSHGYSQNIRWGPSYDCSSLVISAYQQAGVPVKNGGAYYTGNMYPVFLACGFKDVTSSCNLYTGGGMQRGDVLLNKENHTALFIGNGQIVHARSSEGTTDTADNSGNEIRTQGYFNFPWDCILRYQESVDTTSKETSTPEEKTDAQPQTTIIRYGMKGSDVKKIQEMLIKLGFDCGTYGADGEFGYATLTAVKNFQRDKGIEVDGIVGDETMAALNKAESPSDKKSDTSEKTATPEDSKTDSKEITVGCTVEISKDATYYGGQYIPRWVLDHNWIVLTVSGDRVVVDKCADSDETICSPINKKYLTVK